MRLFELAVVTAGPCINQQTLLIHNVQVVADAAIRSLIGHIALGRRLSEPPSVTGGGGQQHSRAAARGTVGDHAAQQLRDARSPDAGVHAAREQAASLGVGRASAHSSSEAEQHERKLGLAQVHALGAMALRAAPASSCGTGTDRTVAPGAILMAATDEDGDATPLSATVPAANAARLRSDVADEIRRRAAEGAATSAMAASSLGLSASPEPVSAVQLGLSAAPEPVSAVQSLLQQAAHSLHSVDAASCATPSHATNIDPSAGTSDHIHCQQLQSRRLCNLPTAVTSQCCSRYL